MRNLGRSGLQVSPLAFGGNVFGWTVDETESFRVLDQFVASGFNLIDTADEYAHWAPGNAGGESETIIGKWLSRSGRRDSVLIATKVGKPMGKKGQGLSKNYILSAVEDSLQRLQTDYIDLYQAHIDDPNTPLEETVEAFAQLIKAGKVRAIGASNFSASRLALALETAEQGGFAGYQCLQPLYNLYDRREFETELAPLCLEKGLGVMTYFSLASGFLTGKYRDHKDLSARPRGPMVQKYFNERGWRILQALDQVSVEFGTTPACVALAWLMNRPAVTAPIASATNLEQLQAFTEAIQLELDHSAIYLLDWASA